MDAMSNKKTPPRSFFKGKQVNHARKAATDKAKAVLSKYPATTISASSDTPSMSSSQQPQKLPNSFNPGPSDVICGRGKGCYNAEGNRRFRTVVRRHMQKYQAAQTKLSKTIVLGAIVDQIRERGRFVARSSPGGVWMEIPESRAREKTGHAMREALSEQNKMDPKGRAVEETQEGDYAKDVGVEAGFQAPTEVSLSVRERAQQHQKYSPLPIDDYDSPGLDLLQGDSSIFDNLVSSPGQDGEL